MIETTHALRVHKCDTDEELKMAFDFNVRAVKEVRQTIIPMVGIKSLTTHHFPHLDEIVAFVLILIYGKKFFPDVTKDTPIRFADDEQVKSGGGFFEILRLDGEMLIGIGRGPFDEHVDGGERKGSSARLVAQYLGVVNLPEVEFVLRYVDFEDNNGDKASLTGATGKVGESAKQFFLATRIKNTWSRLRKKKAGEEEILQQIRMFMAEVEDIILSQKEINESHDDVLEDVEYIPLKLMSSFGKVTSPKLAVYRGGDEKIVHHLWKTGDQNIVAVVKFEGGGKFQVMTVGKRLGEQQMAEVVKALRSEVVRWKNERLHPKKRIIPNWVDFLGSGEHPDVEGLYYQKDARHIYNGSHTRPNTKGLVGKSHKTHPLTERLVIDIVRTALETNWWPKERLSLCEGGVCTSSPEIPCPIYHLGLYRCYKNRKAMHEAKQS